MGPDRFASKRDRDRRSDADPFIDQGLSFPRHADATVGDRIAGDIADVHSDSVGGGGESHVDRVVPRYPDRGEDNEIAEAHHVGLLRTDGQALSLDDDQGGDLDLGVRRHQFDDVGAAESSGAHHSGSNHRGPPFLVPTVFETRLNREAVATDAARAE